MTESSPAKSSIKLKLIVLVLVLGGVGAWLLLRSSGPDSVIFANGFEIPVTATLTDESGSETVLEIPAKGRASADLAGKYSLKVVNGAGKTMVDRKASFRPKDKRKDGCFQYYNILGAAAITSDEIVYGVGISPSRKVLSGYTKAHICQTWGFETKAPPKAISTEEGTLGRTLHWVHYLGDGDWFESINYLLDRKREMGDQTRIRAWNLAVAVSKYDQKNSRLQQLAPKFEKACNEIVDMFQGGILGGKVTEDCLANHRGLFGKAKR